MGSERVSPERRNSGRLYARHLSGLVGSVTANSSGRSTLVAMVQARVLPAQDGHLMSQGDEFDLQREATTNPEREQPRADRSVSMPMTV